MGRKTATRKELIVVAPIVTPARKSALGMERSVTGCHVVILISAVATVVNVLTAALILIAATLTATARHSGTITVICP